MYKITRDGSRNIPKVLRNTFATYSLARSAIKRWLTKQAAKGAVVRTINEQRNRTWHIANYGFSVAKS